MNYLLHQNKKHYGFIAQELENVYPELVSDSEMGFKTVNYIEMIPILLSQIQSMQMEINMLKDNCKCKCNCNCKE